jgi:signal peptidase I
MTMSHTLQVEGPSMFPTFSGNGDLVVAEALPTLLDRIEIGASRRATASGGTAMPSRSQLRPRRRRHRLQATSSSAPSPRRRRRM